MLPITQSDHVIRNTVEFLDKGPQCGHQVPLAEPWLLFTISRIIWLIQKLIFLSRFNIQALTVVPESLVWVGHFSVLYCHSEWMRERSRFQFILDICDPGLPANLAYLVKGITSGCCADMNKCNMRIRLLTPSKSWWWVAGRDGYW